MKKAAADFFSLPAKMYLHQDLLYKKLNNRTALAVKKAARKIKTTLRMQYDR